jgi:hypothetical protein
MGSFLTSRTLTKNNDFPILLYFIFILNNNIIKYGVYLFFENNS